MTRSQLAVALDNIDTREALSIAEELRAAGVSFFKVGLELYTKSGSALVKELQNAGSKIFLDLKLHDIPNTVGQAVKAAADLGVDVLTVHAAGGPAMLEAAAKGTAGSKLKVVAVTLLTSLSDSDLMQISQSFGAAKADRARSVAALARMAAQSGVAGIVSSALDLDAQGQALKQLPWHAEPFFVTPGIRSAGNASHDQAQTATPELAVRAGASLLVVGRPILSPEQGSRTDAARYFLKFLESK